MTLSSMWNIHLIVPVTHKESRRLTKMRQLKAVVRQRMSRGSTNYPRQSGTSDMAVC